MNSPYHVLRDQSWLVTGASSGIGAEITLLLAPQATCLVLSGRNVDALNIVAMKARQLGAGRVETIVHDLGDLGAGHALAEKTKALVPNLNGLINCAGATLVGSFETFTSAEVTKELQCNARSIGELIHKLAPLIAENGPGWVLNVASVVGFFGLPTQATYSASKSWLVSLGCALHHELSSNDIVVTTVCPGATHTQFMKSANIDMNRKWVKSASWHEPKEVAIFALRSLIKRKMLVTPGFRNRFMVFLNRVLSRSMIARIVRREMEVA
ncbi:MAG: short-subunit dehydrogenase [Planctomycetota bacterium]|jgi:short-subunit dehydrogenase